MRTSEAAENLGCSRQFLMDVSATFPGKFADVEGNLYAPNGGLSWSDEFIAKMKILANLGLTGMPAVRVARIASLEGDSLVIRGKSA